MNAPVIIPKIELDAHGRKIYRPDGRVLREYIRDRSHVSIIRGSIGSGTSTASIMKMWAISTEQARSPDTGLRHTRWAVVRNTFPELKNTTVKTWLDWFNEDQYGRFFWDRPYRQVIRVGDVEMEVIFLALDSDDDIRKLRSFEFTGIFFNELEFTYKAIVDEAESRTGRFPAMKDGGPTWDGVIADMNAPPEDHWVPLMMGEVPFPEEWTEEERLAYKKPNGWSYFVQPPAMLEVKDGSGAVIGYEMNPEAENVKWLKPGYYEEKIQGKSLQFIKSRVLNQITVFVDGKAVWQSFTPETHVAKQKLETLEGYPIFVGLDFGRNPAMVAGQIVSNRWRVFAEAKIENGGASVFAPIVKALLDRRLLSWHVGDKQPPGDEYSYPVYFYGDPKGQDGTQADETTAYDIFASFGMTVVGAPVKNNHINTRIEAVEYVLNQMANGLPRFQLCPDSCRSLKVAMSGGYHYARIKGTSKTKAEPEKDRYSDLADALQYMILGGGEGRVMIGGKREGYGKPISTRAKGRSRRRGVAG